jgi:predicted transcriptional regulator
MKRSRHNDIRKALLSAPDGLTAREIADKLGVDRGTVASAIKYIYGVYIDRWSPPNRGQHSAIYVCIEVPENTPRPKT